MFHQSCKVKHTHVCEPECVIIVPTSCPHTHLYISKEHMQANVLQTPVQLQCSYLVNMVPSSTLRTLLRYFPVLGPDPGSQNSLSQSHSCGQS